MTAFREAFPDLGFVGAADLDFLQGSLPAASELGLIRAV
jgi:hypothetical protein